MIRTSHSPARIALVAASMLGLAGLLAPAYADHQPYPTGWNMPATAVAPVLYQFVPGGSRMHVVPPGTTAPAWSGTSPGQPTASSIKATPSQ